MVFPVNMMVLDSPVLPLVPFHVPSRFAGSELLVEGVLSQPMTTIPNTSILASNPKIKPFFFILPS
jgi:hypothetical protein